MGQEAGGSCRPHAVVMPHPLQGHVIPAVHLSLRLAERGFTVTFVNTEFVHQQIAAGAGSGGKEYDIFAGARAASSSEAALDVRYELVSDGFPLGFDRTLNHDQFMEGVLHVLPAHVEELLRRVVTEPATTCLIIDTFYVWPATLARKLGVPYVSFWTEPALVFNLYYHMDLLTKNGHFRCKEPQVKETPTPAIFSTSLQVAVQVKKDTPDIFTTAAFPIREPSPSQESVVTIIVDGRVDRNGTADAIGCLLWEEPLFLPWHY